MRAALTPASGSYAVKVADRVTAAERAGLLRFLACETGVFKIIGATSINDTVVPVQLKKPRGKSGK